MHQKIVFNFQKNNFVHLLFFIGPKWKYNSDVRKQILKFTTENQKIMTKIYFEQNCVCLEQNIYPSPEKFYMTAGRDGRDIFHV